MDMREGWGGEGLGALGEGNRLESQEAALRKVTLDLSFRLQCLKGSNPTPPPLCCGVLDLFLHTPASVFII